MYDPTDFGSSDENIPHDYEEYLDELHVPILSEDDLMELELFESDSQYMDVSDVEDIDDTDELDFD